MDPCQQARNAVAQAQDVYDSLVKSAGPPDFNKPQGAAAALQKLEQKKAELAACIKTNTKFTITGDTPKPGTALTEFDKAIEDFCRANAVRAGQLTILKGGVKKFEHAYTLAYPPYPTTEVDSLFRIASISKAFTCGAIQTLLDEGKLKLSDAVFPLLDITHPALSSQKADPNINKITVNDLVMHVGGFNDKSGVFLNGKPVPVSFDPVFALRDIAVKMGLAGPPSKIDIARYMFGEPLQFPPGSKLTDKDGNTGAALAYSNFGYVLLGLVVERRSGMPYIDFVRQHVLEPIGVSDVFLSRMLAGRLHREVTYDDPGTGPSAMEPHSSITVANPYGGAGFITELMDSGGGLMATATAIAQFINKFPAWGLGHGRGGARSGEMSGTAAWAESNGDVDMTFTFNTSTFPGKLVFDDPKKHALTDQLEALLKSAKL